MWECGATDQWVTLQKKSTVGIRRSEKQNTKEWLWFQRGTSHTARAEILGECEPEKLCMGIMLSRQTAELNLTCLRAVYHEGVCCTHTLLLSCCPPA